MHRMEAGVAKFAALVVGEYAGLLTQHIDEQRLRTELTLDMARAVSASLELPDVLRRAAPRHRLRGREAQLHLPARRGWCYRHAVGRHRDALSRAVAVWDRPGSGRST